MMLIALVCVWCVITQRYTTKLGCTVVIMRHSMWVPVVLRQWPLSVSLHETREGPLDLLSFVRIVACSYNEQTVCILDNIKLYHDSQGYLL